MAGANPSATPSTTTTTTASRPSPTPLPNPNSPNQSSLNPSPPSHKPKPNNPPPSRHRTLPNPHLYLTPSGVRLFAPPRRLSPQQRRTPLAKLHLHCPPKYPQVVVPPAPTGSGKAATSARRGARVPSLIRRNLLFPNCRQATRLPRAPMGHSPLATHHFPNLPIPLPQPNSLGPKRQQLNPTNPCGSAHPLPNLPQTEAPTPSISTTAAASS